MDEWRPYQNLATFQRGNIFAIMGSVAFLGLAGCRPNDRIESAVNRDSSRTAEQRSGEQLFTGGKAAGTKPAWYGRSTSRKPDATTSPVVLFDSYHAHNFIHRGLVPGEHNYHHLSGLRRAAKLLEARGCEIRELLVGPVTAEHLADVQLVVINLPSMDRPPWIVSEIAAVEDYVRQGGGLLFITDHSNCYYHQYHLLPLWQRLGLIPTFETVCERRADCRLTPSSHGWILVREFATHPVTSDVRYFAMQTGGRVVGEGVVGWTSNEAWADAGDVPIYGEGNVGLYGDMRLADSEEQGKQGVVLARNIGLGRVAVIGDQNSVGDGLIAYAHNWRLWLNATRWCGQLEWRETGTGKTGDTPENDRLPGLFERIVADEPDRNAPLASLPTQWTSDCWEPMSRGPFHFGGGDPDQFYNFWSWMNRWTWTSAADDFGRPNEHRAERRMLIAIDTDFEQVDLLDAAQKTLEQNGRVFVFPKVDLKQDETTEGNPPFELALKAIPLLPTLIDRRPTGPTADWLDQPLPHWRLKIADGELFVLYSCDRLRNKKFSPPETSPNAAAVSWQNKVRQWLFE